MWREISKLLPKGVTITMMSKGQVHVQRAKRKVNLPTKLRVVTKATCRRGKEEVRREEEGGSEAGCILQHHPRRCDGCLRSLGSAPCKQIATYCLSSLGSWHWEWGWSPYFRP